MKLKKISIENYRSINNLDFEIKEINNSYTYSLLGINESGKSSFLKALSLFDDDEVNYPEDYFSDSKPIKIIFHYSLEKNNLDKLKKHLTSNYKFDRELLNQIMIKSIEITSLYDASKNNSQEIMEKVSFEKDSFPNYTLKGTIPTKKGKDELSLKDFNLTNFFEEELDDYFWEKSHQVVLWKSTSEYLMLDDIDLHSFAEKPKDISIPLLNCFRLAGIKESLIKHEVSKLSSAVAINSLQTKLSELTTKHINNVWPEHPISITFQIDSDKISLLIEDNGVKFQPKTTGQRSDGFKQFISFLLTISVENYNGELDNTILLVDEPETHLHPPAQINLLKELIKISSNEKNNILFFATHSNYLIDKENLDRNYKVFKQKNHTTFIQKIEKKTSSYSEVNFEVFGIETTDYHNELYGYIEAENKTLITSLPKKKIWKNTKINKEYDVSLSEYIRHSIHHPENQTNLKYTDKELSDSIKVLKKLKDKI